ncbi:beta/gamma crystallin family protein [Ferruginibacter sp. HRS2-29]|uniref:beta/gamma crystallin family protein n=1 Tax=Ferruginibacter sp. HRS2-29 TaxID=2487334 RepID=UPI0020CEBDCA|nr:beta/gamma crystallin family protein [Ferruginibacter sp. HRS2-29]MCP9753524.1 hypothetical protein [Ferruginibacter sp. HRS2-29]
MKPSFTLLLCLLASLSHAQLTPRVKPTVPILKDKQAEMYTSFRNRANKDEVWFFEHAGYGGKKYILGRGQYTLKELGMDANDFFSSALIPTGLMVVAFEDDNIAGTYYTLNSDNNNKRYNTDFTKVEIYRGKDAGGRMLSGIKDINDKISSIIIFDMLDDEVTLYEDCNFGGQSLSLTPCPMSSADEARCFSSSPVSRQWGWLNLADLDFNDKLSSIKIKGQIAAVRIHTGKNLEISPGSKMLSLTTSHPCLKNKPYTTDNALFSGNSDWNDRASSLSIIMKPGTVTIVN